MLVASTAFVSSGPGGGAPAPELRSSGVGSQAIPDPSTFAFFGSLVDAGLEVLSLAFRALALAAFCPFPPPLVNNAIRLALSLLPGLSPDPLPLPFLCWRVPPRSFASWAESLAVLALTAVFTCCGRASALSRSSFLAASAPGRSSPVLGTSVPPDVKVSDTYGSDNQ